MTTRINLLDWRKERRERRKKEFAAMMGLGVVAAGLALLASWTAVDGQLSYQQARNEYLRTQIKEMDQQIKEIQELERVKTNLLARMHVIEELQASRSASVHFFDEIVNTLPEGVNLTNLKQQGSQVTLDGIAESNGRISTYMKNLDASPWFQNPKLIVIKTGDKDKRRKAEFKLQVTRLTTPGKSEGSADGTDEGVVE
ncbi:PilN domain-containing protein [Sinimarinibacterium sp. CAU 1509]|uniref:PilN domain-containing protein n=1 Tax=Sinimarinibacterium sp. CAU 1509 TaxID=2562283 RepID=UPI0010ACBCD4|nr:PilN domain-containing protein [Sinimarinibacterium sp. CAU 1509]TJY58336.1 PilN domain-containing protein [Sinimarinibacterium sp. CAU 1509]